MQLKLGFDNAAVARSLQAAELFLETHGVTFASRSALLARKCTTYNYYGVGKAPYGPPYDAKHVNLF